MNSTFQTAATAAPQLFARLMASAPFLEKGIVTQKGRPGIYVLFEGGTPVHVGRTRNLGGRLRGHITRSHYSASFAFKRARRILNRVATYRPEGSRKSLVADEIFGPEFIRQIDTVKAMEVRFIEVEDPVMQYLLELYVCLELKLPLDEFDTH
jgi:hypothetical protein